MRLGGEGVMVGFKLLGYVYWGKKRDRIPAHRCLVF